MINSLTFVGQGDLVLTGGQTIDLREAATGRILFRLEPDRPPIRMLDFDSKTGELYFADASSVLRMVNLADLHRAFRDLGLEIPGFPFFSDALLPSPLAEEVLGEPAPPRSGTTDSPRGDGSGRGDIRRVWRKLQEVERPVLQ